MPEYIYLLLRKNVDAIEEIVNRSYGTVRQSLSPEEFLKIQIPIISLEEQNEIVKKVYKRYLKFKIAKEDIENIELEKI